MKLVAHQIEQGVVLATLLVSLLLGGCEKMSETIHDPAAGINGGFEVTERGLPVNWLLYSPDTVPQGDFDLVVDRVDPKEGRQSLRFDVRDCASTGGWGSPGFCQQYRAVPGERYRVSFWVKNEGCEFSLRVGGVSPFEGTYETIVKSKEDIANWKQYQHDFQMPAGKKFDELRIEMNILHPGRFWIDDITIVGPDGQPLMSPAR